MVNLGNDWDEPINEEIPETDDDLCRALWLSVILQALLDARSKSAKPCYRKSRQEAREWFGLEGEQEVDDFAFTCELAGIDPIKMKKVVLRILSDETASVDFRCLKKVGMPNRACTESRPSYFRRIKMRKLRKERQLAAEDDSSANACTG